MKLCEKSGEKKGQELNSDPFHHNVVISNKRPPPPWEVLL